MTVESISWSISTKECCRPRRGLNPRPTGLQSDGASNWATEAGVRVMLACFFSSCNQREDLYATFILSVYYCNKQNTLKFQELINNEIAGILPYRTRCSSVIINISKYNLNHVKRKFPSNMCRTRRLRLSCSCAKYHPGLCPPFIHCVISNDSVSGQWRPWSDCADAQSDLGLGCPYIPENTISHGAAQSDWGVGVGLGCRENLTNAINEQRRLRAAYRLFRAFVVRYNVFDYCKDWK